jgi:hypothetical protein
MSEPVFVDPSGRRLTALRVAGRVAAAVFAGYLLMVGASLVAPPGLDRLQVPGLGDVVPAQRAPEVVTSDGDDADAADAVVDGERSGAPPIGGPAQAPGRTTPTPSRGPGSTNGGGNVVPGNATPPASTARPTSAPGKPTTPPGQSRTPPGQSSAKPKPTKSATAKPCNGNPAARAEPAGGGP